MSRREFNVLFLCTGNSARSIIAECLLNRIGKGRFHAYSAGSQPKGAIHPMALQLLQRQNYPVQELRSKDWAEFSSDGAPELDFVFTLCDSAAAEQCPVWPGQPMTAHWGLPDPAAATGNEAERHLAFAETMRLLTNRLEIFTSLPISSLDRLSLQNRLDEIGRSN
jgi:protein-tyrosine-phosphatase